MPNVHEARSIMVGRTEIPFVEYGEPDGRPTLVNLHGISVPPTHWGELPSELDRHVIAIGLPTGKDAPRIPTMARYAEGTIQAVHGIVGDENSYDVLGLSWGGGLAQQVALDDPSHVRRMVLAGTVPAAPVPFLGVPDFRAITSVWSTKRSLERIGDIYGGDFRNELTPELSELAEMANRRISALEHSRQLFAASISVGGLVRRTMLQRARQKDTPETLVLVGDDDPIIPHLTAKIGARVLGMEFQTVPNGGHAFLMTRPKEMATIINDFLDHPTPETYQPRLANAG